ncbi:MAG: DoxX family membrane protein [Myxococcaceae bacterium]
MRYLPVAARLLLGLIFFVFGLNGFFHFIPDPPPPPAPGSLPPGALAFAGALFATGYFYPLLKAVETLSGLLLLSGRFVPLALTALAPIVVNILFFHAFLHPAGLPLAVAVLVLEVFLAWSYRDAFVPLLKARAQPASGKPSAS